MERIERILGLSSCFGTAPGEREGREARGDIDFIYTNADHHKPPLQGDDLRLHRRKG
jgi:hypothetical protein